MRVVADFLVGMLTFFVWGILWCLVLIVLAVYWLVISAISLATAAMALVGLFCTAGFLFVRSPHVGLTALGYWGYTAVGMGVLMVLIGGKLWLLERAERRQARLEQERLNRIGKLRLVID